MGTGFTADTDALRRASRAAAHAAETAATIRLPEVIEPVALSLPGSQTASGVTVLVARWRELLRAWCEDAETYATNLPVSADRYDVDDQSVAALLRRAPSGVPL